MAVRDAGARIEVRPVKLVDEDFIVSMNTPWERGFGRVLRGYLAVALYSRSNASICVYATLHGAVVAGFGCKPPYAHRLYTQLLAPYYPFDGIRVTSTAGASGHIVVHLDATLVDTAGAGPRLLFEPRVEMERVSFEVEVPAEDMTIAAVVEPPVARGVVISRWYVRVDPVTVDRVRVGTAMYTPDPGSTVPSTMEWMVLVRRLPYIVVPWATYAVIIASAGTAGRVRVTAEYPRLVARGEAP